MSAAFLDHPRLHMAWCACAASAPRASWRHAMAMEATAVAEALAYRNAKGSHGLAAIGRRGRCEGGGRWMTPSTNGLRPYLSAKFPRV